MSTTTNELYTYKVGFDRAWNRTPEVMGGLIHGKCKQAVGDLYRKEGVYQRITGGGFPQKKTTRNPDSPTRDNEFSRRRVTRNDFHDGVFVDWSDLRRMTTDPKNEYMTTLKNSFYRQKDRVAIQSALGVAKGGIDGETDTAFDTDNVIPVTLGASSGNASMTYDKLLRDRRKYLEDNVSSGMGHVIVIAPEQWESMMKQEQFINSDYSMLKRSEYGPGAEFINGYMGCDWIISNMTPYMDTAGTGAQIDDDDWLEAGGANDVDGTDIRACYSFIKPGVMLEVNPDMTTDIEKRADKSFNWYAYCKMAIGGVRMFEEYVHLLPCDQSPA